MGNCTQTIAILPDEASLRELAKWVYLQAAMAKPWNYDNEGFETSRSITWGVNDNGHHSMFCTHKSTAPQEYTAMVASLGGTLLFRDLDNDGGRGVSVLTGKYLYNGFAVRHGMAPVPMKEIIAWLVIDSPGSQFSEFALRAIMLAIGNRAISYFSVPVQLAIELCHEKNKHRHKPIDTDEGDILPEYVPPTTVVLTINEAGPQTLQDIDDGTQAMKDSADWPLGGMVFKAGN